MLYVILAGISVFIITYQLFRAVFQRNNYIKRIEVYTGQIKTYKDEKLKKTETYRQGLNLLAKGIERSGIFINYKKNIRNKLTNANVLLRPEEYLSICLILCVCLGALGWIFFGHLLIGLIFSALGGIVPSMVLKTKKNKRLKTINNQLGDTIAVISNAMKAGHSFFQAIDSVSRELKGPISEEFTKLQKEISLGVQTEIALLNMVNRTGSDDLELMVTAVLIQRQTGGNLSEVLDNISDTIRQRIRTKGEIKTLTAQGRMSGIIIACLPFCLAAIVSIMSPDLMLTLVRDPIGIFMIVLAFLMEFIGVLFIRKIINIEV